ncbi:RNA 2'-phosphotransferase [Chondromyces crocatus]|uniref:Probable RNA 2'-phosphotransferase n=1 Tax=Chondromyces crocatus TaxID=52 RepID=A0A0K1E8I9_CHOCO|nr:RNA 2'-phosphotransferase [Chondromyces crocatus]AKT37191.1 RNA 2'-phosphotransferase [Chondromyces crocatus]
MSKERDFLVSLSKRVSHALRHEPWLYELELDQEGWVLVDDLLDALREDQGPWAALKRNDLARMIASADKKRYELEGDRIRALYGHSVPDVLRRTPALPPMTLFHGTSPAAVEIILAEGLKPMRRQHVHLSVDRVTAVQVGKRRAMLPVLLAVQAQVAHTEGVSFYEGNDKVWLADVIPAQFIAVVDDEG